MNTIPTIRYEPTGLGILYDISGRTMRQGYMLPSTDFDAAVGCCCGPHSGLLVRHYLTASMPTHKLQPTIYRAFDPLISILRDGNHILRVSWWPLLSNTYVLRSSSISTEAISSKPTPRRAFGFIDSYVPDTRSDIGPPVVVPFMFPSCHAHAYPECVMAGLMWSHISSWGTVRRIVAYTQ